MDGSTEAKVDGARIHELFAAHAALDRKRMDAQEKQKELLESADDDGINSKVLKRLFRDLRQDAAVAKAENDLLESYRAAYLAFSSTPLGAFGNTQSAGSPAN